MDENFWKEKRPKKTELNFYQECKKRALKSPVFLFIKQYPRISLVLFISLIIIILALPIPFREKVLMPFRALIIGFLIALGMFFYRLHKNKDKNQEV